jgi:hypothetical protein
MTQSSAKKLAKKFQINFQELPGGYQYKFGGYVLTFFPYKAHKWHNNVINKWSAYKANSDEDILKQYLAVEREPEPETPSAFRRQPVIVKEFNDRGTLACIEHLKLKIDTLKRVNPHPFTITVLNALKDELQQYL